MVVARILIVDDDLHVRRTLRLLLEASKHEVLDAANGRAGLRLAEQARVEVLLCDVFMADQDGLETMLTFRQNYPGVPIVAMSGGGFGGLMDMLPASSRLGADRILYKPFNLAALVALLDELLPASREAGVGSR